MGKMILATGHEYDLDDRKTKLNNNVLVIGTSGSGKTRGIVSPNIMEATGSYIIVDPKGNLYDKYKKYLEKHGYEVKKMNFANPGDKSSCRYNPLAYVHSEQDVLKLAHMMVYSGQNSFSNDPFWDQAAELLLCAIIAFVKFDTPEEDHTLKNILLLQRSFNPFDIESSSGHSLFHNLAEKDSFASRMYESFAQAADKTAASILISLSAKIAVFDTEQCRQLLSKDTIEIDRIGQRKTALFIIVSDTDRSMDILANIFVTQIMEELCRQADHLPDCRFPVPIRFILDDFATNVKIADFPRMISSIRSRGISCMLILQAESQLAAAYGASGRTIMGNCDTLVYLGGSDLETAKDIAQRANVPTKNVLYMPIGEAFIFRRGQPPAQAKIINLEKYEKNKKISFER